MSKYSILLQQYLYMKYMTGGQGVKLFLAIPPNWCCPGPETSAHTNVLPVVNCPHNLWLCQCFKFKFESLLLLLFSKGSYMFLMSEKPTFKMFRS